MRLAFVLAAGAALLAACDSGTEEMAHVSSTRVVQRPYVPAPPGTVPRGTAEQIAALAPPGPEPTPELVDRGHDRFMIFCSPCHGASGRGDGLVVSRGFPPPPTYHQERIRALSPAQIVTVITEGKGRMASYADRVPPEDRWAVAHFVKELQAREGAAASGQGPGLP